MREIMIKYNVTKETVAAHLLREEFCLEQIKIDYLFSKKEQIKIRKNAKNKKNINVFDLNGEFIETISTIGEAAKKYQTKIKTINNMSGKKEFTVKKMKTKNIFSYFKEIILK